MRSTDRGRRAGGVAGSCGGCCSPPTSSGCCGVRDRGRACAAGVLARRVAPVWEVGLFAASLPLWVLLAASTGSTTATRSARITRRSTTSSASSRSSRSGRGAFSSSRTSLGLPYPNLGRLVVFWLLADRARAARSAPRARIGRRQRRVRPERDHRRLGQGRPHARGQDREPSRVRPARRRLRRPRRPSGAIRTDKPPAASERPTICRRSSASTARTASSIAFSTDSHEQTLA